MMSFSLKWILAVQQVESANIDLTSGFHKSNQPAEYDFIVEQGSTLTP